MKFKKNLVEGTKESLSQVNYSERCVSSPLVKISQFMIEVVNFVLN